MLEENDDNLSFENWLAKAEPADIKSGKLINLS